MTKHNKERCNNQHKMTLRTLFNAMGAIRPKLSFSSKYVKNYNILLSKVKDKVKYK